MDHKTSRAVQTKRRAMPLVAPFPGLSEHPWVRSWWAAGEALGVVWAKIPFGPWSVCRTATASCASAAAHLRGRQSAVSSLKPRSARQAYVALPQGHHPQLGGKTGLGRERQPASWYSGRTRPCFLRFAGPMPLGRAGSEAMRLLLCRA